jgi:uncharacterized protein YjbI with pentapeptide repeats
VPTDPGEQLIIEGQRLVGRDLSERRLQYFCAIGSRFQRCSFRDVKFGDAVWGAGRSQSEYTECCFDGAKFRSVVPGNARFVNCSFLNVRIYEFFGFDVELVDCTFSGRIDSGVLNGTRDPLGPRLRLLERLFGRKENEISGNDFSQCELGDFSFRTGIDLEAQRLPTGPHYLHLIDIAWAIRTGRTAIASWPNDEMRRLASILLDLMADDLSAGQQQQFYRLPMRGQFALPWERLRRVLTDSVPNP